MPTTHDAEKAEEQRRGQELDKQERRQKIIYIFVMIFLTLLCLLAAYILFLRNLPIEKAMEALLII